MRILFAGTPSIAVPSLCALDNEHKVCAVLTNPDRPSGRGKKTVFSPVKEKAIELGIPVLQPEHLNSDARNQIKELKPDILAVVAYSKIFGPKFLSLFPMGGINLHPSLLPLYRGPSPIQAAILNAEPQTGITVQKIALKMDSGDIIEQINVPLSGNETAGSLTEYCGIKGSKLMLNAVQSIESGDFSAKPQNHNNATYCSLITKSDGRIDWNKSATEINCMIRAYAPWPNAFTMLGDRKLALLEGTPVSIQESYSETLTPGKVMGMDKKEGILIQTGQGVIGITRLQLQSKKAMDFRSFLNGVHDFIGTTLGG